MFRLDGKIALVTGGSRGIGRACAEGLAEQGARVIVNYVRGEDAARDVAAGIVSRGGQAEIAGFDMANSAASEAAVEELAKKYGRLDILVANAGISIDSLLLRMKDDDLSRLFDVNVKGALACARAATKSMMRPSSSRDPATGEPLGGGVKRAGGRIIFVSSIVAEMGNAGQTAYAATKAAIIGASKSIAREFASRAVTVNVIAPGFVDTDMTADLPAAAKEGLLKAIPLGRTGSPREIAGACAYLASDEASYVTGQVLRVNGGMYV